MKIALIGAGNVACNSYLPYLSKRDDLEILIHSRTYEKAQKVAERFNARAVKTLDELAAEEPVTCLVLTHEEQHLDAANALLDSGFKRMFIEKPLNARHGQANVTEEDYFEAAKFMQRAKSCGCEVAMQFNYRFYETSKKLRSIVAERNLGELKQCTWMVNYACWSHCIDLLHFLGGRVKTVSALGEKKENADLAGCFTLENGGTGTILGTNATNYFMSLYYAVLNFEKAIVTFEDLDAEMSIYENDTRYRENYRLFPAFSRIDEYFWSFEKALGAYFDSIEKGEKPPVTGEDGLRELQFEAALRRSDARRTPVDMEELQI